MYLMDVSKGDVEVIADVSYILSKDRGCLLSWD